MDIIKVENKIQSTMLILLGWIGHLHPLTIACVYFRWFLPLRLQIQHKWYFLNNKIQIMLIVQILTEIRIRIVS
jgi:hypothetical protein